MNFLREGYASRICRLCLQDDNILFNVFEKNDGIIPADIICRLLDPKLFKDDGYQKLCCMECIKKLRTFQSLEKLELSPSFMLFREQSSIAKAVFDNTYCDYNDIKQHSPISEEHSPLTLDLDSYAFLEEQKWHYDELLKAVAQILEAMNARGKGLLSDTNPLKENLCENALGPPPLQFSREQECLVSSDGSIKQRIEHSEMGKECEGSTEKGRKNAVENVRQRKRQSGRQDQKEKSMIKDKKGNSKTRFQCYICGIACAGRQDLAKHSVVHTQDRPFPCPICKKAFRHERNLKVHLKIHSGVKGFHCAHCDKSFSTRTNLKSHLVTHGLGDTFSCELCGKIFKRMRLLKLHVKTHTNDRPFKCKICGVRFIQRSELTKHLPVHSGLREFSCSVCSKSFAHKRNLKDHERIHLKDKQFECSYCGGKWAQKSNLRVHLKNGCPMQTIRVKVE